MKKEDRKTHVLTVFVPGGQFSTLVPKVHGVNIILEWNEMRREGGRPGIIKVAWSEMSSVYGPDVSAMTLLPFDAVDPVR